MSSPPTRMAVVGAGLMGSEIAQVAAAAGCEVVLADVSQKLVDRGLARVREIGDRRVARGRWTAEQAEEVATRVQGTTDLDEAGASGCSVAIEAVTERMEVKRAIFRGLDEVLDEEAMLASNTSGLSITELGRATARPAQVVGLHFFNPASVMRLVEVVRGEDTAEATVERAAMLAETLGKTPVRVRECPGFLVNRILVRALCAAYRAAQASGAPRAVVDVAVVAGGPAPMGPFELGDLIGLDTLEHIRRDLAAAYGDRFDDAGVVGAHVSAGRLGRKSGAGFRAGVDAGETEAGDDGAAAEQFYAAAADEARRCLQEGVVASADDANVAMRLGCGWEHGPLGAEAAAER